MKNIVLYSLSIVLLCLFFAFPEQAVTQESGCTCWPSPIENAITIDPIVDVSCNITEDSIRLFVDGGSPNGCRITQSFDANLARGECGSGSSGGGGQLCFGTFLGGFDPEGNCFAELEDFCAGLGDSDGDGVADQEDLCPDSILEETVVIDGCDSGVGNILGEDGCTISDLIAEIADGANNHGHFVSGVAHLLNGLKKDGLISGKEKGAIQSCAAQADIP